MSFIGNHCNLSLSHFLNQSCTFRQDIQSERKCNDIKMCADLCRILSLTMESFYIISTSSSTCTKHIGWMGPWRLIPSCSYSQPNPAVLASLNRLLNTSFKTDSCFFLKFSVVAEFGRIALELLKRGTSTKMYEGAASKNLNNQYTSDRLTLTSWKQSCITVTTNNTQRAHMATKVPVAVTEQASVWFSKVTKRQRAAE